jgi:hypothetical protein
MALQIKDETVLKQIEHLSRLRGMSKADVIRSALKNEMEREAAKPHARDLIAPLQAKLAAIAFLAQRNREDEGQSIDEPRGQ